MRNKLLLSLVVVAIFAFTLPVLAQVALRTGSIYGKVIDDKGAPLPGVGVTLESDVIPSQTATTGPAGGFRFANLPPGTYSVNFSLEGFTEVRQEEVRVGTGSQVQLEITLKPSLAEEFTVIGDTPIVDTRKTGTSQSFNREYLEKVPSGRDPWVIIDQTAGVDSDRYNVAGSESGQQAGFVTRGASDDNTSWNYDGVNATDPGAAGASPTYYDFDAFEELSIVTGGDDASIGSSGVTVNIVTKRGGNKPEANASIFFVNQDLQSENTPQELKDNPILNPLTGLPAEGANRIDQIKDYGFDVGGPIVKDKLFAWGAFRKNDINLFTVSDLKDHTILTDYNVKVNFNANAQNESQFGYFKGDKEKSGRAGVNVAVQAPETLWDQGGTQTITPGIITGQHTFIPSDDLILNARYGYIGLGFTLVPKGGKDIPIIYLASIPRWEDTFFFVAPIDRPSHDINIDANLFKENVMGGDHEFKIGFEYKTSEVRTFSSYGNGLEFIDYGQTTPGGPLTYGYAYAQHFINRNDNVRHTSLYATDTFRKGRMTLNLGVRYDHQTGRINASTVAGVPGFESIVGPIVVPESDPGITFNDVAPRIGATFDLSGNGKTIIRGNFARYYDGYPVTYLDFFNPSGWYNGATFSWANANGDRSISPDEIVPGSLSFYGGWNGTNFDLSKRLLDPNFHNSGAWEGVIGFEKEVVQDLSVAATYTYRRYVDTTATLPVGVSSASFVPGGTFTRSTPIGNFSVPFFVLGFAHDGTGILTNINDYVQTYNGVDFVVRKRMSNRFMLNASLNLQRQKADYNGGDSFAFNLGDGGLFGQTMAFDPTNVQFLDGEAYAYAPGGSGKSGVYPYSEWHFKMSGVYQLPADITLGAFARYQQGYPFVVMASVSNNTYRNLLGITGGQLILLEPFGSRRFDNLFNLDLKIEKGWGIGQAGRVITTLDLFNVTNTNDAIRRNRSINSRTFNKIQEIISPRAFRLGLRYSF